MAISLVRFRYWSARFKRAFIILLLFSIKSLTEKSSRCRFTHRGSISTRKVFSNGCIVKPNDVTPHSAHAHSTYDDDEAVEWGVIRGFCVERLLQ